MATGCDDAFTSELDDISAKLEQSISLLHNRLESIRVLDDRYHQPIKMRNSTVALEDTIAAAVAVVKPFVMFDRSAGANIYYDHDARMEHLRSCIESPYIAEADMGCDSFYFHWLQRHAANEAVGFHVMSGGSFLLDASTNTSEHCNRGLKSRCISLHHFTEKSCSPKYG